MRALTRTFCVATLASVAAPAAAQPTDVARFREIYRTLVETDTTKSNGDCTLAATRMQQALVDAGYPGSQFRVIVPPELPKQGNLIGTIEGSNARLPAVLLLAHIDVVEAKRSDWKRDPFKLVEENGYLFARGAVDDKAMAAAFVDALIRIRETGFRPRRTIKLALTCGEESPSYFNGVRYLLEHEPAAMRAGFAINEGGRGMLDASGRKLTFGVQVGEKMTQDITITATAPGGHSARPTADNAIARLSAAITRVHAYRFPVNMTAATREYFRRAAPAQQGQMALDFRAAGAGTADPAALDRIAGSEPLLNAYLRTTCIPTTIAGGHSKNAQPQHVEVNVNCRIMPGDKPADVLRQVTAAVADPQLKVEFDDPPEAPSTAVELSPGVIGPIEKIAGQMFPGVPVVPSISTGATDGRRLVAAGVPTYGVSGVFADPDGNGVHGLDERIRISSLMDAREFLYRLIRAYGEQSR